MTTSPILTALLALGGSASRTAIARHLGYPRAGIRFVRLVDAAILAGEVVPVGSGPKQRLVTPEIARALAAGEDVRRRVFGSSKPKTGGEG